MAQIGLSCWCLLFLLEVGGGRVAWLGLRVVGKMKKRRRRKGWRGGDYPRDEDAFCQRMTADELPTTDSTCILWFLCLITFIQFVNK